MTDKEIKAIERQANAHAALFFQCSTLKRSGYSAIDISIDMSSRRLAQLLRP